MSFPFLYPREILNLKLLLQVDDYASYDLISHSEYLEEVFEKNLSIKFHYKIFKNTPLNHIGQITQDNVDATNNAVSYTHLTLPTTPYV